MSIIRGILPFLAYAAVSSVLDWRSAAVVAAVVAVIIVRRARREGRAWSEQTIELCGCGWFAAVALSGHVWPGLNLASYVGAGGQLVLAAAVVVGLAVDRPFTLAISRREAPRQVWSHPAFLALNRRISTGWAFGFAFSGLAMLVLAAAHSEVLWAQVAVVALGIIVPIVYQRCEIAAFARHMRRPAAVRRVACV